MSVEPEEGPSALDLSDPDTMEHVKQQFVDLALPRITAHAQIQFRGIRDPGRHDDAVQNSIGIGWKHWVAAIRQGKDPSEFISAIADYAIRQTRSGRRLDRQERPRDVLSPRAQRDHGLQVEQLQQSLARPYEDLYSAVGGQRRADALEERLTDNTRTAVPDQVAFRERFDLMLDDMSDKKRAIVQDLAGGADTQDVAAEHGVSPGRVSQVRRESENWWRERERKDNTPPREVKRNR